MLSRNTNYDIDTALNKINEKKLLLDIILQLLVSKCIISGEEVSEMRNKVKNSPIYAGQRANYYTSNPEQHLKDVFAAKINGTIN